ncbi:hypothetical protein G7046_g6719 [Stylonectria norvegica]|nr:hypothetical protein G7046_g6719 [Stylonectria norvegica]
MPPTTGILHCKSRPESMASHSRAQACAVNGEMMLVQIYKYKGDSSGRPMNASTSGLVKKATPWQWISAGAGEGCTYEYMYFGRATPSTPRRHFRFTGGKAPTLGLCDGGPGVTAGRKEMERTTPQHSAAPWSGSCQVLAVSLARSHWEEARHEASFVSHRDGALGLGAMAVAVVSSGQMPWMGSLIKHLDDVRSATLNIELPYMCVPRPHLTSSKHQVSSHLTTRAEVMAPTITSTSNASQGDRRESWPVTKTGGGGYLKALVEPHHACLRTNVLPFCALNMKAGRGGEIWYRPSWWHSPNPRSPPLHEGSDARGLCLLLKNNIEIPAGALFCSLLLRAPAGQRQRQRQQRPADTPPPPSTAHCLRLVYPVPVFIFTLGLSLSTTHLTSSNQLPFGSRALRSLFFRRAVRFLALLLFRSPDICVSSLLRSTSSSLARPTSIDAIVSLLARGACTAPSFPTSETPRSTAALATFSLSTTPSHTAAQRLDDSDHHEITRPALPSALIHPSVTVGPRPFTTPSTGPHSSLATLNKQ